ncbi:very short patch repair endonuclease [Phreatobacter stygius]|uniref:Very short patch repair endonuclease n=1 Tax=Phreatobacter stygius TaxID=1940610 RepID=A0A4D7AW61_9HYPH|nr:DNA mismatch endonuclease Vsr [Phreatobacter stygius]QCI63148.1 DNA mismatch endonuclease Vsr [Phreatobacter stygius]
MRLPKPGDPKRRALMARVRQQGTAAELTVAAALRSAGHAYRLNVRSLPGSPDFANRKRKWAIFVHGCFWHQHTGCKRATIPKANEAFWRDKFGANRRRDARALRALRGVGFRVAIVWECEIADGEALAARLSKILESRRVDMPKPVDH